MTSTATCRYIADTLSSLLRRNDTHPISTIINQNGTLN
jgi:hypothetical protein